MNAYYDVIVSFVPIRVITIVLVVVFFNTQQKY